MDGLIGTIVSHRYATLDQLRTIYTVEDAYIMWEIIAINNHNERLARQAAAEKAGNK